MKKFTFPLERILNYKRSLYEEARNELARLRHERATLEQRKEETRRQIFSKEAEFHEKAANGIPMDEVQAYNCYRESAEHLIEELDVAIAAKDLEIEKQLEIVIQLDKDVKGLEKLREKQWEEYMDEARHEENERILEMVSTKHIETQREEQLEEQRQQAEEQRL